MEEILNRNFIRATKRAMQIRRGTCPFNDSTYGNDENVLNSSGKLGELMTRVYMQVSFILGIADLG
jgi:hypothetical protein